jgi:4-azaleucine resistance transporter AzlC
VTTAIPKPNPRDEFWGGFKATIPLNIGGIPFGIIFGALAITSGISPGGAMGMSLFVFAGSAQFIATGLVAAGTDVLFIILTTFVVNARHALYSATLAPYVKHLPHRWLLPLGFLLTDEAFVITVNRYHQPDDSPHKHWFYLGSAVSMYVFWQLSTLLGIVAGSAIPDPAGWGLDFAMAVTFIGMLVPMIRTRPVLAAVLVASVTAVLTYSMPNQLYLIISALAGIAAGVLVESRGGEAQRQMRATVRAEEPAP